MYTYLMYNKVFLGPLVGPKGKGPWSNTNTAMSRRP